MSGSAVMSSGKRPFLWEKVRGLGLSLLLGPLCLSLPEGLQSLPAAPSLLRRLYDSLTVVSLDGLLKMLSKASVGRIQPQGKGFGGRILKIK